MKKKLKQTPLPTPNYPVPVPVPLDVETLPDEINELVREGKLESIVYYGSDYGFKAKYKVTFKEDNGRQKCWIYNLRIIYGWRNNWRIN